MKRIIIIAMLVCVQVNAVQLSTNGLGQVLIFPYYTVNNGINTLINIVNTTDQAKALRVRFREAANSREVATFNLYLGAHDVWTGALIQGVGDHTSLVTADNSCTVPQIISYRLDFNKDHYTGEFADGYGDENQRMLEGFIEVIEMGVLTGDSALSATIEESTDIPNNCQQLVDAWDDESDNSYWLDDATTDLMPATGGIMGNVTLINVAEGIALSEEATVINDFSEGILHFNIDNESPSLVDGKKTSVVIDTDGNIFSMSWGTGFEAVSSILMKTSIINEYALDEVIVGKTDWMLTMPTRQYHTDPRFSSQSLPIAPFTSSETNSINCEDVVVEDVFNRETELRILYTIDPPPGVPLPVQALCFTNNNISFINDQQFDRGIFSSNYQYGLYSQSFSDFQGTGLETGFDNGWLKLDFEQSMQTSIDNSAKILGLPVIGFAVQQYTNANAEPGIWAQYTASFKHKSTTEIETEFNDTANTAMRLANNNVGQVLIYPYYTVRNSLNTLISVVNTSDKVKALKIRFNEGKNAREVLDFNIYLDAFDVWTAALIPTISTVAAVGGDHAGQESVKLITADNSCAIPAINGQEFLPFAFTGAFDDEQGADMTRVREGFIEIIEMGEVIGNDALAAMHESNGVPNSCNQLLQNWSGSNGQWVQDPSVNIMPPDGSGGLYGSVNIIDVALGFDLSYDATAIVNYTVQASHATPGSLLPNLSSGSNLITSIETEDGYLQTNWNSPVDAVTALFMTDEIYNDFAIDRIIRAASEWVNMFPTRQFYVDPLFSGVSSVEPPFANPLVAGEGSCEAHKFIAYNREQMENLDNPGVVFPIIPPGFRFYPEYCWSVNVDQVNTEDESNGTIFNSQLPFRDAHVNRDHTSIENLPFYNGWLKLKFDNTSASLIGEGMNGDIHILSGKPVLGFIAQRYKNINSQPGLLANYAVINKNKFSRKIEIETTNTSIQKQ